MINGVKKLPLAIMLAFGGMGATAVSQSAGAQEAETGRGNILEEIIVSAARRRNEDVQTTPVAVTALDSNMLERFHVDGLEDMAKLAPNLVMTHMLTTTDALTVYLRGFGLRSNDPSADPRVAIFLDGVYQPTASGALLDTFDIGEVEVQAGPQGTLAGKNSAFGAVYITSQRPTGEFGGKLQVDYGRFDHLSARGRLNFPIIEDKLAGRVSFVSKTGGDWIKDLGEGGDRRFGGENTQAGRASILWTPTENISWDLVGARMEYKNRPNVSRFVVNEVGPTPGNPATGTVGEGLFPGIATANALGLTNQGKDWYCGTFFGGNGADILFNGLFRLGGDPSDDAAAFAKVLEGQNGTACPTYKYGTADPGHDKKAHGDRTQVTSQFDWELEAVKLTVQYGHLDYRLNENTDVDGTPVAFIDAFGDITHTDQDSLEIRLGSNQGGGWNFNDKLDWLVGVYYSKLDFDFDNDLIVIGFVPSYGQEFGENKSSALT
jgi:outer membrane receptor protein involved in Fe transport